MSERSDTDETREEPFNSPSLGSQLLMLANRWILTGVILLASFLTLVLLSLLELTPLRAVATEQDTIETLFAAFIGAIITGTAIVVTINQLVLSQELGAVGDQYDRMREAMTFRRDVEEIVDSGVSSPSPAGFLSNILEGIETNANTLQETVVDESSNNLSAEELDEDLSAELSRYAESVAINARTVNSQLEETQFGTFEVLWNVLQFDYSRNIHRGRQLREEYQDTLSDETDEALAALVESLTVFAPAREHFKTLYFQWELINLSRALLYVAIPALIVMAGFIMFVDATTLPGEALGVDNLVWLTAGGFTVGITPFVIFMVYVLRIATVAKQTLAMGPFVLR